MKQQNFENHSRYFPLQHFIWLPLSFVLLLSAISYSIFQIIKGEFTFGSLLLLGTVVLAIIPGILARIYAVKLQDRLIRTEEQLRYYILTGKRLDPSLTFNQLIALRFAPDEEYVGLVDRTLAESFDSTEIKEAIREWRADYHRV